MLINFREKLLNLLVGISPDEVLNPDPPIGQAVDAAELASQLNQTTSQIKADAIDPSSGLVNYSAILNLESYQSYLEELIPQLHVIDLAALTELNTRTAFWINLYNALTVHAVIAYNIIDSIAAGGFSDQIRFFRQAAYNIRGLRFSLEDIEHGILRANAGNPFQYSPQLAKADPRIRYLITDFDSRVHFALNCASISCPPINFYSSENLEAQLDLASANFVNAETRLDEDRFYLSRIFNWYRRDFGGTTQIADFLITYLPDGNRKDWLRANRANPQFKYLPYDWGLNKIN